MNAGVATALVVLLAVAGLVWWVRSRSRARRLPGQLAPGQTLPGFAASRETGEPVSSEELLGKPAVILFVRGNWCPFCSRQVADLTQHYRRINELGARLVLVTPKPLDTTRRVAEFFEVDFEFWLDEGLKAGRQLGLVQTGGVPAEYRREYGDDTLWPAALVTDAAGTIRYATASADVAERPDPARFVTILESL